MPVLSAIKRVHAGRQSFEGYILGLGPVGYWPLREVNGTVAEDLSVNANNGTYTNTPTLGVLSPIPPRVMGVARAVQFDGTDYVDCGNLAAVNFGSGDFTFALWLKATGSGTEVVLCNGSNAKRYQLVTAADGRLQFQIDDGVNSPTAAGDSRDGNWHSVVCVRGGSLVSIYVDGTFRDSSVDNAGDIDEANPLIFGARSDGAGGTEFEWEGQMSHVPLWGRALDVAEIEAIYLIGINGA